MSRRRRSSRAPRTLRRGGEDSRVPQHCRAIARCPRRRRTGPRSSGSRARPSSARRARRRSRTSTKSWGLQPRDGVMLMRKAIRLSLDSDGARRTGASARRLRAGLGAPRVARVEHEGRVRAPGARRAPRRAPRLGVGRGRAFPARRASTGTMRREPPSPRDARDVIPPSLWLATLRDLPRATTSPNLVSSCVAARLSGSDAARDFMDESRNAEGGVSRTRRLACLDGGEGDGVHHLHRARASMVIKGADVTIPGKLGVSPQVGR